MVEFSKSHGDLLPGVSCGSACGPGSVCDPAQQNALTPQQMANVLDSLGNPLPFGSPCQNVGNIQSFNDPATPGVNKNNGFCFTAGNPPSTCEAIPPLAFANARRLCCCVPPPDVPPGQVGNDPHVHTLKGAHYTLLKSGNFLAWSFSKDSVDWHLLAAYSGARLLAVLAVLARLST